MKNKGLKYIFGSAALPLPSLIKYFLGLKPMIIRSAHGPQLTPFYISSTGGNFRFERKE